MQMIQSLEKVKERAIAAGMKSQSRLNIELEPNVLSLRDDAAVANRDKNVNAEFSEPAVAAAAEVKSSAASALENPEV